ncbi:serine-rich adhesin for platelets-like [Schistocerca gregaria]|uniref:serine-rich adhesin for platelets-like n=1 Tax=Schistocerca gregaria TaxID=7010 RepID=UPI00211ED279|nr:serine-rich adhesin for platelets-like [Schistocerca gregaria]XP_049852680.1 serine-rich adhesin for platelets-like [Schistocerca gregaria]XP_049852681.1 serine-rich adhesin for platelets-like [Schistocerca gregaria]
MKQEEESGNSKGGEDGVTSGTAPNESISKSSGDPNDAPKVVSGSAHPSGGEDHATEPTGIDGAADSTSPERNTAANTSGSSMGSVSTSSPSSEMEKRIGRPDCDLERSSSSINDSVSDCNQRDSSSCDASVSECNQSLSSCCSECSIHSGVIDKCGRHRESSDVDHSHPPPVVVPNLNGRQAESADESVSEFNPRDSVSSTSLSSTPSGVIDRSGRKCESTDTDNSPPGPPPGTASSSVGHQADAVAVESVTCQPMSDSLTEQDAAMSSAGSAGTLTRKMTLRSGRVTQVESVPPKKHRDVSDTKRLKSVGKPPKRRFSVDDQSQSSSEENPEKLLRLESSDTMTCLSKAEGTTSFVNNQSGDITNVSSDLPRETTSSTVAEDSSSENERLLLANPDDVPVSQVSPTFTTAEEEAMVENEKSVDEKLDTDRSESAPDNEQNPVDKEVLDQPSTSSDSSAYQAAKNHTETDPLPPTAIGGDEPVDACAKPTVPEIPTSHVPCASDSVVSREIIKEIQPTGAESRASRSSALTLDKNECSANNYVETTTDTFAQVTCDGNQEHAEEKVNNATQENYAETPAGETSYGSRRVALDLQNIPCRRAARDVVIPSSFFTSAGRRDSEKSFERNVRMDVEIEVNKDRMQAAPDSSTEVAVEGITSKTATKIHQQVSTNISHLPGTDVTRDVPLSRPSRDHSGLIECTKKIINDIPHESRNTASSNMRGNEDNAAGKVPQEARHLDSSEESDASPVPPPAEQYDQRNLQIYRYITTNSGSDIRYSPYVTRRRPLRPGYSDGDNYRRTRRQPHGARQADNGVQTTRDAPASFGEACSIS